PRAGERKNTSGTVCCQGRREEQSVGQSVGPGSRAAERVPERTTARGVPRRQAVCVTAKRVLVAAVAGALDLVEPIGELLVVEVELLIVVIRLPVLERNLRGRILGLRRDALALDTRRLSGDLRAGLCRRARAEVRPFRAIRTAAPDAHLRPLRDAHRRDGH